MFLLQRPEPPEIGGSDMAARLDFDGRLEVADDEVDFVARVGPPERQRTVISMVGKVRTHFIQQKVFEGAAVQIEPSTTTVASGCRARATPTSNR